ncbi:MAG TPA: hypothetical protein VMQ54_14725 [Steroidobacteraceae bacterium]|jgi:hypothetical protein|nr:hypothetical protein [Steroidobacteraceae bacterium]
MNWREIEARWFEYLPLAKRRWLALSDEQFVLINGRRQLLSEQLQASYGVSRENAELEIDRWCNTFGDEEPEPHGSGSADHSSANRVPDDRLPLRRRTNPYR